MPAFRLLCVGVLAIASCFSTPVRATAFSTDQSDLWWNPAESGWGIQFVDRADTIFATMFVFDANNVSTWYVATMPATGAQTWTGDLYAVTHGTWFGNPTFTPIGPNDVRKVGTMTWNAPSPTNGTLTYTVDGHLVTKQLVRQFIALDDFSGTFRGGIHQTASGCNNPADNNTLEDFATVATTQQGSSFAFTLTSQLGLACSFTGTLAQDGRFGRASGTATCAGKAQPVTLSTMVVGVNSLTLHYDAADTGDGCKTSGYFSGARHR